MLCHFGQTWSSYVANLLILRGSTATSSATGDYVAVPQSLGQDEETAGSNEKRTEKNLVLLPKVDLTNAIILQTCNHNFPTILCVVFFLLLMIFQENFPKKENPLIFVYTIILFVGAGISTLMSFFMDYTPLFLSKDGKDAANEGTNGWKAVYFSPELAFFLFI